MASGTIYATIPAVFAAGAGIYFFDRNHSKSKVTKSLYIYLVTSPSVLHQYICNSNTWFIGILNCCVSFYIQEHGGGIRAAIDKLVAKAKEEEKTTRTPKLAPQFDGLHCFETFVGR